MVVSISTRTSRSSLLYVQYSNPAAWKLAPHSSAPHSTLIRLRTANNFIALVFINKEELKYIHSVHSYMHRVDVFQFLFVDKESLQKEALQSMAVKILTTNYSLVNGTSNMTQM